MSRWEQRGRGCCERRTDSSSITRRPPSPVDLAGVLMVCAERGPFDRVVVAEQTRVVVDALGRLPRRERALLLLREQHRLPLAEIGRVLDLPVGTVKTALHRARLSLAEALPATEDRPAARPGRSKEILA
ncbi:MAG: sigma-70 family RNA polymerase sigma factor [Planctomycetes bacterium]|nr:sigma-70 family RNA polymerase sigma factor [Planctomycetota bacterium]